MIYYIEVLGESCIFIGIPVMLTAYFGWLGMAVASAILLWMPGINHLAQRTRYPRANELNNCNPLYARGFMRKNASRKLFLADLRGLYYCQMASILPFGCALIYMSYIYFHNFQHIFWFDVVFIVYFTGLFLICLGIRGYYCCCYNRDFRYVQNENGIWKPFSYIVKPPNWGFYRPFHCRYQVEYKEMRERLIKECERNGYLFPEQYQMEEEQEAILFTRMREQENTIFELIHIKEYSDAWMEKLNDIFADYWETHIKACGEKASYSIIFLLCIDEYNTPLRKRLLSVLSVDQAKGRYRLPATLVYSEHFAFDIPANYRDDHGKKMYDKMRKELLEMLDISERFNDKEYPEP